MSVGMFGKFDVIILVIANLYPTVFILLISIFTKKNEFKYIGLRSFLLLQFLLSYLSIVGILSHYSR